MYQIKQTTSLSTDVVHNVHLVSDNEGGIHLMVDSYYVLHIVEDGGIILNGSIGKDSGLSLDKEGYIKPIKE